MRTSKPLATISYNTDSFLLAKLEQLRQLHKISFYMFVKHKKESDDLKDHTHLFIVPDGIIDSHSLKDEFDEFDPNMPDKPLVVMEFHNSKFGDWYLYSKHDKDYLASKYLERKYHYVESDFTCSDYEYFHDLLVRSDFTRFKASRLFLDLVEQGYSFADILKKGVIPINMITQFKCMYNELMCVQFSSNTVIDTHTGKTTTGVFR